jgi:uracil-DNA glycosylase
MKKLIQIPDCWYTELKHVIESKEFLELGKFIAEERKTKTIYPYPNEVFRVFNEVPLKDVRVFLSGQDPYPTEYKNEPVACGLSFAPRNKEFVPPSLRIIYNNIKTTLYDDNLVFQDDLDLTTWTKQGVFLLNAGLTVEKGRAGSHLRHWEFFTKEVIKVLSKQTGIIFMLWGKEAQKTMSLIDTSTNHVLVANHPASSIYSKEDWNCNHFKRVNEIITLNNGPEYQIKWLTIDQ